MKYSFLIEKVKVVVSNSIPKVDPILLEQPGLKANDRQFWITVKDVGEFYAEEGKTVVINPTEPQKHNLINLYLNGSVLGAILQQRCIIALHGSSISYKNQGIIFCGESGFGKSTLAYAVSKRLNCPLLTDDITPIKDQAIIPIAEQLKLTQQSATYFNIPSNNMDPIDEGYDKYFISIKQKQIVSHVRMIYIGQEGESIHFQEVLGSDKLLFLLKNQYWQELNDVSERQRACIFDVISELSKTIRVFIFTKPHYHPIELSTSALTTHVLEHI